jgi:hypothetical protein
VLMDLGAAGDAFGTPLFMAPEVLAGRPSTPASDVYSLGVLLFQLVTASHPELGTTLEELRGRHARNERRLLRDVRPDLPERFVRAVERATAPAERRFQSAGALEAALAASLELPPPAPAARRIGPWVLGLTGWALALAGLGLWLRLPAGVPETLRESPLPPTTLVAPASPVETPPAATPEAPLPTVPTVDVAGPIAAPSVAPFVSESESKRAEAERVLNAALAALARKASQAEVLLRRFDDSCRGRTTRGTTVKQGPRGPYTDTFNVDNETTPACLGYSSDGRRLLAEIEAGLEQAEEDARRARLLPGAFRDARRRHGLEDVPVWR